MNKYDFGYDLRPNTTIAWAYEQIEANSEVLELGPSNGNLVFHLTKEKNCIADIVELNPEAGNQAAQFSRTSCVGDIEGNLEREEWFQILSKNRYDYIVLLDVLEHVKNPREVMSHVNSLLKDTGTILLSIPNVAHNSILVNLLKNRFQYTTVGLLDETHVRFYTYESIKQLLNSVGLVTVKEEVKQEQVGQNEVAADYGQLPLNVEAYLKTRPLGTAYQFLFSVQRGTQQSDVALEYVADKLYELVVFNQNEILAQVAVNPTDVISTELELQNPVRSLRIDPLDRNCVIQNWEIRGWNEKGRSVDILNFIHTGNSLDNQMIFYDDDPQIYAEWAEEIVRISIQYKCAVFDDEGLRVLMKQRDQIRLLENNCQELTGCYRQLQEDNEQLLKGNRELQADNQQLLDGNRQLLESNQQILANYQKLSDSALEAEHILNEQIMKLKNELESERQNKQQWQEMYQNLLDNLKLHKAKMILRILRNKIA